MKSFINIIIYLYLHRISKPEMGAHQHLGKEREKKTECPYRPVAHPKAKFGVDACPSKGGLCAMATHQDLCSSQAHPLTKLLYAILSFMIFSACSNPTHVACIPEFTSHSLPFSHSDFSVHLPYIPGI